VLAAVDASIAADPRALLHSGARVYNPGSHLPAYLRLPARDPSNLTSTFGVLSFPLAFIAQGGSVMSVTFPQVRVGQPICGQRLSVFPLFADVASPVDYRLASEAIAEGTLTVDEVSEAGSVPTLSVDNQSDRMILFLEGEQLIGAKQNRILNASILVAANSKTTIPVSCVEQGRWRFKQKSFGTSGTYSPSKLRYSLKHSVSESLEKGHGHRSDQGRVWDEVASYQRAQGVSSPTSALEDTFESHREKLSDLQKRFQYVAGASGLAVALDDQVVTFDLFDKPDTCHKVWDRLLSGVLLEALIPPPPEKAQKQPPKAADVEVFLADLSVAPWQGPVAAGEGREFRSPPTRPTQASALCYADHLIHSSALAPQPS
jgi:ARG and Rhodanese-Phosphatase-superfamily-associated Protein domain